MFEPSLYMGLMSAESVLQWINNQVWGIPMMVLLLGTGVFLTMGLRLMPLYRVPYAFSQLFKGRKAKGEGDVSPFAALMTALSSTIGTGNIAGVAVAIAIGGPGALFWMWMTAVVGMATKYAEGVLAVKFRETSPDGRRVGGPMYYIKNGLGKKWAWLGFVFATFGVLASWGTGASIQSNSVGDAVQSTFGLSPIITAVILAVGAGAVILGGIKRIASVAESVVPLMAVTYLVLGLIVVAVNITAVPAVFSLIIKSAFGFGPAAGGIFGAAMMLAMQKGIARGIFSNEAGQGSAPIAHAAAANDDPVNQGIIAMLGTLIDTLIVCSITGFVILTSGVYASGDLTGAPLTAAAFNSVIPFGDYVVTIALIVFAFTTILGWSYYGERCAEFIFGKGIVLPFRISWIFFVFFGSAMLTVKTESALSMVDMFWLGADTLTGLMALPNLIALLLLSPLVFKMTNEYFKKEKEANKK